MKITRFCVYTIIIILFTACSDRPDPSALFNRLVTEYERGNFQKLSDLTDSLRKAYPDETSLIRKADSILQISERIRLDYSLTAEQFIRRIESYKLPYNDSILSRWDKMNWSDRRIIDGEMMYFRRSPSNIVLLRLFHEDKEEQLLENSRDPELIARMDHTKKIIEASRKNKGPVFPVNMKINYTLKVDPDVVPEGEIIRCWLPWPRTNHPRQKKIEFISASQKDFIFSPDSSIHKTIYMEQKAVKGISAVFTVSFSYESSGLYVNPEDIEPELYDRESELYKNYTREELPQIRFSDNIKKVADSITSPDDNPFETVSKIYLWFKENIPWTGALEYSTMPDIPAYVLNNRRGDCGMQTLLYISMLRYKGIPVRWQSGWMVPPGHENLHDWCEIYFEGVGWVPSDISYDLQANEDKTIRQFFMTGIDSYRLIVNDGIAGSLYPEKIHLRSEPYDFQRGEVEWKGGNLYFDKWDYNMDIEYFKD